MLGRMFTLARQDDKMINRPHIPKLKEPAQPRKGFFEYGDFVKVRDHLDPALRNIAEFEYVTGWRIDTEVLPLEWRQVDFAAGEVRIDDPRSTKNEQARVFPFTEDLQRALLAQRTLAQGLNSPYVFCHLTGVRVGERFSYGGFYKTWLRAVRAAGVARCPMISGEPRSETWNATGSLDRSRWRWLVRRPRRSAAAMLSWTRP